MKKFWAKSENFFFDHPPPSTTTIRHNKKHSWKTLALALTLAFAITIPLSLPPSLSLSLSLYLPPSIPRFLHHSLSSLFLSFSEHFASLVIKWLLPMGIYCCKKKKVPATYGDFIIFFKKKPNFENWSWIFFHLKKFLKFFGEIHWMTFF